MPILSTLLQATGSIFGQKVSPPQTAASSLDTAASVYSQNSNNTAAPLIQSGLSTTSILVIAGAALIGLLIWKRK